VSIAITSWPWGIEQTAENLWIGPLRPDGMKVEQVVVGLNFDSELTTAAKTRKLANAQLIAASPELLEALQGCVEMLEDLGYAGGLTLAQATAAIAKATGEA